MCRMTATELQAYLLANYPVENEAHEWKAWRSIPNHAAKKAGEDIASYVSAISNMEGGTLVIGAGDKTLAITGARMHRIDLLKNVPIFPQKV
jgi:ATP-dependent DNA helicase RecG